jgi:hypothetical protein
MFQAEENNQGEELKQDDKTTPHLLREPSHAVCEAEEPLGLRPPTSGFMLSRIAAPF